MAYNLGSVGAPPPCTILSLHEIYIFVDKQFDVPDRTFHAIETTWNLSSFASAPDVKELIPEFFFLPEFLLNLEGKIAAGSVYVRWSVLQGTLNIPAVGVFSHKVCAVILPGFDFGVRQNGERVMDVRLPSWACNDSRLFILIHRQVNYMCFIFGSKRWRGSTLVIFVRSFSNLKFS